MTFYKRKRLTLKKKYSHSKRYKDAPDELNLEDFLASHIAEKEEKAELALQDRMAEQAFRERKVNVEDETIPTSLNAPVMKKAVKKAYIIMYGEKNPYLYIAFSDNRDKAKYQSFKYYKDKGVVNFSSWSECDDEDFKHMKLRRAPDLDKYAEEGKIPIPVLLKMGFEFPCSSCGKDNFDYSDYEIKRCFIIEDDGVDLNPYTKGVILCYNCYKKLMGEESEK